MTIQAEVLRAALRLCRERGEWSFTPDEVVRALPDLNPRSVQNHVVSRCCVNAPKNHPHKGDYFRRLRRGVYEVLPVYREQPHVPSPTRVAEGRLAYEASDDAPLRESIHVTNLSG